MAELKAEEQPLRARTREIAKRIFRHEDAVLAIILVVIVAALAGMTKGITASRDNVYNVLLQSSSRGLASIGQTFVILTSGIDVSVGGRILDLTGSLDIDMLILVGISVATAGIALRLPETGPGRRIQA